VRCQRSSVGGVTRNDAHRSRGSARLAAASRARSSGVNLGRPALRRSTRSWCLSTRISRSLVPSSAFGRTSRRVSRRRSTRARRASTDGTERLLTTRIRVSAPHSLWNTLADPRVPEVLVASDPRCKRATGVGVGSLGSYQLTKEDPRPWPHEYRPLRPSALRSTSCSPRRRRLAAAPHPEDLAGTGPAAAPQAAPRAGGAVRPPVRPGRYPHQRVGDPGDLLLGAGPVGPRR
jgi:hypothetical protein